MWYIGRAKEIDFHFDNQEYYVITKKNIKTWIKDILLHSKTHAKEAVRGKEVAWVGYDGRLR